LQLRIPYGEPDLQASLPQKLSLTQYANCRFLADLGDNGELHFALLNIEDSVRLIPLCVYSLVFGNSQHLPALANGREEGGDRTRGSSYLLPQLCYRSFVTAAELIGCNFNPKRWADFP
jgi:hypothetical protein